MEHVLLIVQVLVGVALVGIILLQRSETDGFGLGSGSGSNLLTGRATANLLTRATAILATLFILNSLALSIIAARSTPSSIVEEIKAQEAMKIPAVPTAGEAPTAKPAVPTSAATVEKKVTSEKKEAPAVPAAQ